MAGLALDAKALQQWVDGPLAAFIADTKRIREDDAGVQSLRSKLAGETGAGNLQQDPFLAIGGMANDDTLHGKALLAQVKSAAKTEDAILENQVRLFKDIDFDMRETIATMGKTQAANLASIDGAAALDDWSDIDHDLSAGTTGSGAGGGGDSGAS